MNALLSTTSMRFACLQAAHKSHEIHYERFSPPAEAATARGTGATQSAASRHACAACSSAEERGVAGNTLKAPSMLASSSSFAGAGRHAACQRSSGSECQYQA